MLWRAALLLAGLGGGAAGCGEPAAQDVTVHWQLADGRSCIDAAVVLVTITTADLAGSGSPSMFSMRCPAAPGAFTQLVVPSVPAGAQLQGQGLSASATVLYRGAATVPDPIVPNLELILYFTGGR